MKENADQINKHSTVSRKVNLLNLDSQRFKLKSMNLLDEEVQTLECHPLA